MRPIEEVFSLLNRPRRTVITMHQKPDADAMGSALALRHFLEQLGHTVAVVSPTNWASWLNWMPGAGEVLDYEYNRQKADTQLDQADWLFCLDFNAFYRTKSLAPKLAALTCTKILIDHHQQPDEAAFEFGISDTSKSSTCEMIYDFIVGAGYRDRINMQVAECIYAGVVADTGSFRFESTHAGVHRLVADLKEMGLRHSRVHDALFDNFLENRLRFVGHVLQHRMEVFYEYNTVLIAIPKSDLLKFNVKTGDTEGLVNFPLTIQGIKLAALVIDRDEERKWSFRSKGEFDCNTFARKYFEGGGHYNASGGRSSDPLDKTVQTFLRAMKENKSLLE
ncbi:MAG TPA: bifunctional oligoribonuclease/PAP phosphatase NrnA [Chitinophagaceae bacterium]|nr:bifunctional oligoribonuclease/PAP phosphatase NrnA [Chitinophagaceae bacterium]